MVNKIVNVSMPPTEISSKNTLQKESTFKNSQGVIEDSVTISGQYSSASTYSITATMPTNKQLINDSLREYVIKILEEQGLTSKIATGEDTYADLKTITPEEAQKLISEDGYWGVEKTSERIFKFAISAAGNDVSKLEQIKEAVQKGFKEAEEAFGGTLPDISYKTLERVMEKLDKWAEEISTSKEI